LIDLVSTPIDLHALLETCQADDSGALALFVGRVRNHHQGHAVAYLEYEAYDGLARQQMQAIADEAQRRWPILRLAMVHRVGRLQVGQASVVVVVATAHRAAAFEACRYLIDTLKREVPIWKKETGPDGQVWIEGDELHQTC
jgi:molybdopterin synthase catalytic subunit